jgi:LmbE family N-acetylglucosaminyl deacetylase
VAFRAGDCTAGSEPRVPRLPPGASPASPHTMPRPGSVAPLGPLAAALFALASPASALAPQAAGNGGEGPRAAVSPVTPAGAGIVDAALLLRQLDGEKRVLMIAAHPDDEDTALLTTLARGMGARTAYLSLSRGEGGQNLIGPELDEGLGLVRTGELLSARSLDGAEQYFSRAFDFGFSKTAAETFSHWPEDVLVDDVVRVMRRFRPQVVISVFHGSERDGHGHHQAAGIVSTRAFEVAADPAHDDGLEPWSATKLYRLLWGAGDADLLVETGGFDPLLGRSHFQVAMASRSRHRSQDMGVAETPGPRSSRLQLAGHRGFGAEDPGAPLFAGVDTSLVGMAEQAGGGMAITRSLQAYRDELARARAALHPERPSAALPALRAASAELTASVGEVQRLLDAAAWPEAEAGWSDLLEALIRRERILSEALLAAASVIVEVRAERPRVSPGESLEVEVIAWNGGDGRVEVVDLAPRLPDGWSTVATGSPTVNGEAVPIAPGELATWSWRVDVPETAHLSTPYFLREARDRGLYRWPAADEADWTRPGNSPPLGMSATLRVAESVARVERAASHVQVDKALGEEQVPVFVVPALSVSADPGSLAWPSDRTSGRAVTLTVANLSASERLGQVRLEPAPGWTVDPASHDVALAAGTEAGFGFVIAAGPDALEGVEMFRAVVSDGDPSWELDFRILDYPHIDPVPVVEPARLRVSRFPVSVRPGIRVGYVVGPGEGGLHALRDLGVAVDPLTEAELRAGDLSRFDAIVVGERAYETRPDLAAANARLLDFARAGGTVIVQYNKYEYPDGEFAPYPLSMRRPHDRVTDPDAPVTLLEPDHPVLASPNRIGPRDFEGWVQERGLYFLNQWDERYTPLIEMADPGEDPVRGALVVASVGEGVYVYTGLSFFRQFPRGVPGAFRLLANLVSLRGQDLAH